MSCEDCNREQEEGTRAYYYRWGIANIAIICCEKHAKEIIDFLNETAHMRNK